MDNLVKQQAALKGFSVSDVAGAFTKLESVTRNTAEAVKLLSSAEDLARGTGKSLAVSALGVEKAYEGSATSLARYGIIIHPVETAVEALRAAHARAIDTGQLFTAQQNAQYAIAVRDATLRDKTLTGLEAIAAIQARFGGEAATFANTAAGQWDRMQVSVHELEVTIGTALLPTITAGIGDITRWADELANSTSVQHAAATAGHDLATGLHDIESVAKTVGPALGDVAKFGFEVVSAIGAPALLAAAGVYEGIAVAAKAWGAAEGLIASVTAAGQPARVAEVSETQALTAALVANTAALTGNVAQVSAAIPIYDAYGGILATVAAEEQAAAVAGTEAAASFSGGLAALTTSGGALTLGIAALAGGLVYLMGREQSWNDINNAVAGSVQNLTGALQAQKSASGAAADASAAAAKVAEGDVVSALEHLTSASDLAIGTFGHASDITGQWILAIDKQRTALANVDPVLSRDILLIEQLAGQLGGVQAIPPIDIQLLLNNKDPAATIAEILAGLNTIDSTHLYDVQQNAFIGTLGSATNPIDISKGLGDAATALVQNVQGGPIHVTLTNAAKLTITQLQQGIALATSQQADLNQQMADAVAQGAIAVEQAVQQAQVNFITIGQSIATSIGTYVDTPLTLAGNQLQLQSDRIAAIQQGLVARFAGQSAQLDRETAQLGLRAAQRTLALERQSFVLPGVGPVSSNNAEALQQLQRYAATLPASGRAVFQHYIDQFQTDVIAVQRAQISLAEAVPIRTAAESAQIALKQSVLRGAQDRATIEKAAATASINDWAAQWLAKKITLQQFQADVAGLLRRDIGGLGNVARIPGGLLLEQQLRGQIAGIALQAQAIQQGPQQLGAGFLPQITHPLTALQNEQKQIASIAHSDATTAATIATDSRNILKTIYGATKNVGGLSSLSRIPPTASQVRAALAAAGLSGS